MRKNLAPVSMLVFFALLTGLFSFASAAGSAPIAENLEISTYRGVSVGGRLNATDPDGGALRYAKSFAAGEPVAVPMRKSAETETLKAEIDRILQEARDNGKLAELSVKYFGVDLTRKTNE